MDEMSQLVKKVTRGRSIVADGWAGASNPHPHPNPPTILKHTQKVSKTFVFLFFNSITMTSMPTWRGNKAYLDMF